LAFAQGELGLKPWEFWELTWPEYDDCRSGYGLRQEREWDRTRHIMTIIHNVNCSKKSQQLRPDQLIRLSWDRQRAEDKPPTEEEQHMMLLAAGFTVIDGKWTQRQIVKN
jgi:hypothetical protein